MKMKKMICAAFCGLAVLTMAGCGELKPDQVMVYTKITTTPTYLSMILT